MELYQYRAMDEVGRIRQGRLSAPNLDDLESRLQRMGLDLISCKPVGARTLRLYSRNITRRDLINFCFQLEQLTSAGVPLLQGLTDVRDTLDNSTFREIVSSVIDRIVEGKNLSGALEEFPRIFDPVFVNLIRVGEQSGELSEILRDLTETLKWQDELASRTKKVLMYPAFVGTVVMGVVFFLMIYLVPQLVRFITSMEGTLPLHTRVLLAVSGFFQEYWWVLIGAPPLVIGLAQMGASRNAEFRLRLDDTKLRIWFIGDILRKLILARFARVFALMYRSGVPVLEILAVSGRFTGNASVEQAIALAREQIAQGESISRAFESTALFPPLVLRMISVGETTGALDRALNNIGYFYDRDVKERIDKLEAMVEPAMTVILGVILAWIMLAVLGPIYDLVSKIKA
jgi:type IV pilus assembly protein PilC